ncbi:MAG: PAS-domain containing protein [Paracoccaceae bacterium]
MTALDMIREGSNIWNNIPTGPMFLGFILLCGLGFLIAAATHRTRLSAPRAVPKVEKPTINPAEIILENAPFPIWSLDTDATLDYTNARYREIAEKTNNSKLFTAVEPDKKQKIILDGAPCWFSFAQNEVGGKIFTFALPSNALAEAETAMKRLMETLSTTFAHLPVGLAVFDADNTVKLFNPALSALLNLDPTWLAMRPTMASVLEKLRDNQHLPEQLNFLEWRRLLTDMESAAQNQGYSDQWNLPNGRILQVSGQPHSQGAATFLFQDITAQITVERRQHAEMVLNQAVLDHVSDALVIITPAGNIGFANAELDRLFDHASTDTLDICGISTLAEKWPQTARFTAFWARLREFISQSSERMTWEILLEPPISKQAKVFPLPDGSTLVSFTEPKIATDSQQIMSLFQIADAMFIDPKESTSMTDTLNLNGLADFLKQRDITLNAEGFSRDHPEGLEQTKTRRILWYLTLAASNNCQNGGEISLTSSMSEKSVKITCTVSEDAVLINQNNHLSHSLLRQLVRQAGGGADWVLDDTAYPRTISCILPIMATATVSQFMAGTA